MCGISGILSPSLRAQAEALAELADDMGRAMAHRGPDQGTHWIDPDAGLALAHRRLSIVDLSPAGRQPMISASGRFVLVYNGELYNTEELRTNGSLNGVAWRGRSDTEVLLESIAHRGLDAALTDTNGMFALALYDRREHQLHLVRDRLGIKPLFIFHDGRSVAFASELKALIAAGLELQIDPLSVSSFLRLAYVPGQRAIFQNVVKVAPGEIVSFNLRDANAQHTQLVETPRRRTYWQMRKIAVSGVEAPLVLSDGEAIDRLDDLLLDAVQRQMVADVDLGAFLSGGIDSSTIVAKMVEADRGRVRTFSIGFPELGWNEAPHARAVADHLGTDHTELIVSAREAMDTIPTLVEIYDEPFGDSSQIPTLLVSRLARQSVAVALSGDGGDELFAGYNRHLFAQTRWPGLSRLPMAVRRFGAQLVDGLPDSLLTTLDGPLHAIGAPPQVIDKLKKIASILPLAEQKVYARLASVIDDPEAFCPGGEHTAFAPSPKGFSLLDAMRLGDMESYLPDDILQKVDRASMAVSLEARPPLLDHRIVDLAWRLPTHQLIRNGETKWLLRQVLDRHVPRSLIERPKMGFGVPLTDWLRGPLKDWANDLIRSGGFGGDLVDQKAASRTLDEHLSGKTNNSYALWNLLMFESWRRRWN